MPLQRTVVKDALNLGVVAKTPGSSVSTTPSISIKRVGQEGTQRFKTLEKLDQYFNSTQYDKLRAWDSSRDTDGQYIPIRQRKPSVIFNLPKLLVGRASSKLIGQRAFPRVQIADDPETEQLTNLLLTQSKLKIKSLDAAQHFLKSGSVLITFKVVGGIFQTTVWNPKHCSPQFNKDNNELEGVRIQYKFKDEERSLAEKREVILWFRLDITTNEETLYDNPEAKEDGKQPEFKVQEVVAHGFGFVPAEWITNGEMQNSIDGESILTDILDLSDAINYQMSQSDQAITYTQEPQLAFTGMDEEEIDKLVKSATKAWNLGREGKASFVEIDGKGIELAKEHVKGISQKAQDLAKVVILDPERLTGIFQSAKAMEVMHQPLVDLIHEVRPWFGSFGLVPLMQKMVAASILLNSRGELLAISFPPGFQLKSLNITLVWKPVFEPTLQDIQNAVSIATSASTANIISRETATKFVAEFFGIEDAEQEQKDVIDQPLPPSPFGPFGF